MEEEEARRSRASTSHGRKPKGIRIKLLINVVRELIQEVINVASCVSGIQDDVSSALSRGSTTMDKSKARAQVLERYLNKLEDDHEFSEPKEEEDEEEPQDSQEEDEDDSDAN
ncbi:hypothetical protein PIB30_064185 [Stylosanthes scabra]|uniref:Uncharacterized protein n=1 Tax=Stylosanthes scabra TaxID=79078 RepID=A0ABU6QM32_9FABA|nr:hypothetical protein [Stylosanthes scabra]